MSNKLWGGRFKKKMDPAFEKFSQSLQWDKQLLPYELKINSAQAKALKKCGILSSAEEKKIQSVLALIAQQSSRGLFKLDQSAEDVHSVVQAMLIKLAGGAGEKLHAGRSRNDLVSQSTRLYCKDHGLQLISWVKNTQKELLIKADQHQKVLIPGMTHMQPAQVISWGHILMAYVEMLDRDVKSLSLAVDLSDVCVLGSGALAGTTFKLDQALIAKSLSLGKLCANSYDVSGDRDYILHLLFALTSIGNHLSRIAEDWMLLQSKGFAWLDMDESFCTGSSMMPQKKNADFLELTRGASGIFLGNFTSLAVTMKGLPTSYNRDLQWDKRVLFDSVLTGENLLKNFCKFVQGVSLNEKRIEAHLADETLYATDLADALVRKGYSFKSAHEAVGNMIRFSEENKVPLSKIGLDILKKIAPEIDGSFYDYFEPVHSVHLKTTLGSTHPSRLKTAIYQRKKEFGIKK